MKTKEGFLVYIEAYNKEIGDTKRWIPIRVFRGKIGAENYSQDLYERLKRFKHSNGEHKELIKEEKILEFLETDGNIYEFLDEIIDIEPFIEEVEINGNQ